MAPLERALAASEAAVVARVEALERYAKHVSDAERALLSQNQIDALRAHLPEYEQLVAETGAARFFEPRSAISARTPTCCGVRFATVSFRHMRHFAI